MKNARWPSVAGKIQRTGRGTVYLTEPGVALVAQTETDFTAAIGEFLAGFDESLNFDDYAKDPVRLEDLPGSEGLAKFAGQCCYMSFGPNRTSNADVGKYLENIKSSGHGSVFQHASFSFLIYGGDRSFTHELVRHCAGTAYSQVSQRYVNGKVLRFVEREEYQQDPVLHRMFEEWIDLSTAQYDARAARLMELQSAGGILSAENKRDLRKKVNQAARAALPNETEAPIVITANARAWRHICEMRASEHADVQIRRVIMRVFRCLVEAAPNLFSDYVTTAVGDGTVALSTQYRKV